MSMGIYRLAAVGCVLSLVGGIAQAVPVTLCGPNICYEYDDDPLVNAGVAGFGLPTLLGGSDSLEFTPTNFQAAASGPNGFDTNTQIFQFDRVYSISGEDIASITVAESGDYQIINGGTVNVNLRLQVVDQVDDGGLPGFPEVLVDNFNWNTSTPTGLTTDEWALTGEVFPGAEFVDLANDVDLQIQNTLQAFTPATGGFAQIDKKLVLTVATVPVPATVWLLISGLATLLGFRGHRQA